MAEAYAEAWDRGTAWRDGITRGLSYMRVSEVELFREGLTTGLRELGLKPAEYGLDDATDPVP